MTNALLLDRLTGMYRGSVSRVDDPEGRSRIRARVPSVLGYAESAWALPQVPFTEPGTLPRVGDPVWITFEGGDPAKPIWVGTWLRSVLGTGGGGGATLGSAAPLALGTAAAGTSLFASREDHVHPFTGLFKVYNVLDYGAVGDGVTDDYAAITACINASTLGSLVIFPGRANSYMTSQTIVLRPGRSYVGAHRIWSVIKATNGSNLDAVLASEAWMGTTATTGDNPTFVSNLGINANRANQSSGAGHGVALLTFWDDLQYVEVQNCLGNGIHYSATRRDGTEITGSSVEHHLFRCVVRNVNGYGIRVYDPTPSAQTITDGWLNDCVVQNVGFDGIRVDSSAGWRVEGCHLYGLPQHGIHMGRADSTRVEGNYIETWGTSATPGTYAAIAMGDGTTTFIGSPNPSVVANNTAYYGSGAAGGTTIYGILTGTSNGATAILSLVANTLYSNGFFTGIRLVNQGSTSTTYVRTAGNNVQGWATRISAAVASGVMQVSGDLFPVALATTATDGFARLPSMAGVPSGVPSTAEGIPIVVDSTNKRIDAYIGGGWVSFQHIEVASAAPSSPVVGDLWVDTS